MLCFSCVGNYQQSSTSKEGASCPYCRGEIPEVADKALDRSIFDMVIEQLRHQKDQRIKRNMQSFLLLSLNLSWKSSTMGMKNHKWICCIQERRWCRWQISQRKLEQAALSGAEQCMIQRLLLKAEKEFMNEAKIWWQSLWAALDRRNGKLWDW